MNIILQALPFLKIPAADSLKTPPPNVVDSAKVAIKDIADKLANNPSEVVSGLIDSGLQFGLKVLAALAIYFVGIWLIRRIRNIINRIFLRRGTDKAIVSFVNSFVSISMTILLIVISISTLGVNTTSLAALLAAGGMAIGMALSGTVQNFAGGIMILVFKPFKVGDLIKAQGYEGYVQEVSIVSTKIRAFDNSIIIMPNGALSNGNIDNFSHNDVHRVSWGLNLEYGTDFAFAKEKILDILRKDSRIINMPDSEIPVPTVNLTSMKDSTIEISVRAWVKVEEYWFVLHELNERFYTILPQHGLKFGYPKLDVNIKQN